MSSVPSGLSASEAQVVGCGSATTRMSSASRPFIDLRDPGDAVAAVALHEHRLEWVPLVDVAPSAATRRRTSGSAGCPGVSIISLEVEAGRSRSLVGDLPDPRPVLPGAFGQAVVERQAWPHRARCRSRPARCRGRGRCWRRCPACRRCRWPGTGCSSRACWRCRRCDGSAPMHQMIVAGFCFANISAMRFIWSPGTPVMRLDLVRRVLRDFRCGPRPCRRRAGG